MKLLKFLLLIFALNISAPAKNSFHELSASLMLQLENTSPQVRESLPAAQLCPVAQRFQDSGEIHVLNNISDENISKAMKFPEFCFLQEVLKQIELNSVQQETQQELNQFCITCGYNKLCLNRTSEPFFAIFQTHLNIEQIKEILNSINNELKNQLSYKISQLSGDLNDNDLKLIFDLVKPIGLADTEKGIVFSIWSDGKSTIFYA